MTKAIDPSRRTLKIAGASVLLLALVWQHIEAIRLGYQVEQSRRQIHVLQGQIGDLDMRIEKDLAPAQLAQQARARLGMFPASPESLRILGRPEDPPAEGGLFGRLLAHAWRLPSQRT